MQCGSSIGDADGGRFAASAAAGIETWWGGFLADLHLVLKQQQPEVLMDALWEQHR
jgi:hypothetical protein